MNFGNGDAQSVELLPALPRVNFDVPDVRDFEARNEPECIRPVSARVTQDRRFCMTGSALF